MGGDVLALYGDLGSGKTTLIQAIGKGMGIDASNITSPTFVLIQAYSGQLPLVHADLYRLESSQEYEQVGLSDYFDGTHVVAIEWAENMSEYLPEERLEIHLSHQGLTKREIRLHGIGTRGVQLVDCLIAHDSSRSDQSDV